MFLTLEEESLEEQMDNIRHTIKDKEIEEDIEKFKELLRLEYHIKGNHSAISLHEVLGAIDEELDEFKKAVHDNDDKQAIDELFNIMIAAMWGINSR